VGQLHDSTWLLLLLLDLVWVVAGYDNDHPHTKSDLIRESKQTSKIWILVLLLLATILVFGVYAYQLLSRNRDHQSAADLERLKDTDRCLKQILANFSIQHLEENKFRGITPKLHTASLEFENICCSVLSGNEERSILEGITGKFQAYHLSAIMGPSGCGKSTLLDVLTGKKKNDSKWTVKGDLLINDKKIDIQDIKPVIGFVPQDDVVHEGLTVRENIYFSAARRMPSGTTRTRLRAITNDVLQVLQLESRQNLLVGNRTKTGEGLSGGQKKRVNVGLELAACPTILFLDEPTSGLDATASLMIVQQLKRMARLGVTIVMVIHQPRYDLFTLLDNVLLLGTVEKNGGRLAYMGPTVQAKSHFESLGLFMPENWNPADWMMDILCGQNLDQQLCSMPVANIPTILFDKWRDKPIPGGRPQLARRGTNSKDSAEEIEIIKQHCKDCWSEIAPAHSSLDVEEFGKVLKHCTGGVPDEHVVKDIMRRAGQYVQRRNTLDLPGANANSIFFPPAPAVQIPRITLKSFCAYLLSFRGVALEDAGLSSVLLPNEESETDSSEELEDSDEADPEEGRGQGLCPTLWGGRSSDSTLLVSELHRTQPGCCEHFRFTVMTSLIAFWRTMGIKVLFFTVMVIAAAFLAVMDYVIFQSPRWMPTSFLNAQIALALLISVYSLQLFSFDQAMYWREASHGLNRFAFFAGRTLVNTLDWSLMTLVYLLTYYCIARPDLAFQVYIWPFILVSYVASGWGYAISCCIPVELGAFVSAILAFMMGGILGLPSQMAVFLDGHFWESLVDTISFTRWSAAMSFLEYIKLFPPTESEMQSEINKKLLHIYQDAYTQARFIIPMTNGQWWTGIIALLAQGTVLRIVAYLGLRFTNRARQI